MKIVSPGVVEFNNHGSVARINLDTAKLRLSNIESQREQYVTRKAYNSDVEEARAIVALIEANTR